MVWNMPPNCPTEIEELKYLSNGLLPSLKVALGVGWVVSPYAWAEHTPVAPEKAFRRRRGDEGRRCLNAWELTTEGVSELNGGSRI